MKKFALIMIVGALALSSFAACGGNTTDESKADSSKIESSVAEESKTEVSTSTDTSADVSADEVDLTSLSTTLKTMITAEETLDKSGDDLYNDTGIAPETYANYFWFSEISGLSSECVAVFEAKDAASLDSIKGFLDTYRQACENQMKDYNKDNYEMITKAVIKTVGNYAYIVISPNVTDISAAIDSALA